MKNELKVLDALQKAFIGKETAPVYNPVTNMYDIYMNNVFIGAFRYDFFKQDFENPEIEIKIKAPLYNIKEFLEEVECDGIFYHAVERGLEEWEKESRENN